jgi:MoaA/NifB/PqqE/SkfB family radical SAM enzyme
VVFDDAPVERGESMYVSALFAANAPLKVYFDFTRLCNLACRHCITSSGPTVDRSNELPTTRILDLVAEMASYGVLELAIGGGEPFVHPAWPSILQTVDASGMNFIVTTNGLLVTQALAQQLAALQPLEVRVSFDGPRAMHESIRGHRTYDRALRGLARLADAGINTAARVTLGVGAEDGLETLFSDLADAGTRVVKIAAMKMAGRAVTDARELLGYRASRHGAARIREQGEALGLHVQFSSDDFPLLADEASDPKLRDSDRPSCGAGFETCHVAPTGHVLGCSAIPQLAFGSLKDAAFADVWESKVAAAYRGRATESGNRRLCEINFVGLGSLGSGRK